MESNPNPDVRVKNKTFHPCPFSKCASFVFGLMNIQRRFIRNFFNIRLTNKHIRVDENYVILGQNLHFSLLIVTSEFTISFSMFGFWFLKNKYNHSVRELILIFKSKSHIAVWKMYLLTEHFLVYDSNKYLNAEKN